jgi:hypothetical protein
MADTQRPRAQILALFADNVTGQISEQDLRDFVVTVMEEEFSQPGDFFKQPEPIYTTTDKYGRGWIQHSQIVSEACSFMNVMVLGPSGTWLLADVALSARTGVMGVALDSYVAGYSEAEILREGVLYHSVFSAIWSGNIGRPLYLQSGVQGSISYTVTTNSVLAVGYIEPHSDASDVAASGKWRFKVDTWAVRGT